MSEWININIKLPKHEDIVLIINHFEMSTVEMASCNYTTKHKKKKIKTFV